MPARAALSERPPLDLPPPYRLVTLRERGDAFAHACDIAKSAGAGTFVFVGRFDTLEFAVVLEPEQELGEARRAFFAGMLALADGIAAYCPPEKPVRFDWPGAIRYDGALLGGGRLGWPADCREDEVPDWLVFSGMLIASKARFGDPGLSPDSTSLEDEAVEDGRAIVESFARHLMLAFDIWAQEGFGPLAEAYLGRLDKERAGDRLALDRVGDLVVVNEARPNQPERRALTPGLLAPSWLDPVRGAPRLDPGPRGRPA